jgi:uncharacterized membrane protein YphA (DoxX/SURF4 family)
MKLFSSKALPRVSLAWIALLRIMLGVMFLTTWASNLSKGYYTPDGLTNFFTVKFPQAANPLSGYASFIENVILPARYVFAPIQLVGECLLGIFLLVGVLTRLTSIAAAFFIANTFLATLGQDWPWSYAMILGILFVVFCTQAGRSLGVDGWLVKKRGEARIPLLW